jgi:enoyl-CoA hydratase/carnithine racemase
VGELVQVRSVADAVVLTLNRPDKLNALSTELERELDEAISSAAVRESRCVLLAGEGRCFSAGADVTEFVDSDPGSIMSYYRDLGELYERVARLAQPTIAAIHGYCLGGGLELALACDLRVADETAVFGLPEVEIGILPSSGGTYRLTRMVGAARAKELVLARPRFNAREAERFGVVTEVVPAGGALDRALEYADRLVSLPPIAVQVAKQAIDTIPGSSRDAGLMIERLAYGLLSQTDDAEEAARAFVEKRPPRFTGR